jgi:dienelactone hydrolase
MTDSRMVIRVLAIGCIIAALAGVILLSDTGQDWRVTKAGLLEYPACTLDYELKELETADNYTLYAVRFISRETEIAGLLRMPVGPQQQVEVPGVVLLPGATVTKEGEQGLATYLCGLGYASIALDQRNLGIIDIQGDLQMFMDGEEPTEHKMVYDALAAAAILRNQPKIDPNRVVDAGESNGARFAIIACALDPKARGVVAISTCGYGVDAAITSGRLNDRQSIRFYKSVDPETYLGTIPPRKFVMLHSVNDTIIDYENAEQTFSKAKEPKELHTVTCTTHGYCAAEMADALKAELEGMVG